MSLIVKICGLSTPETLDAALDAGSDMVGFVFFPPSPRHLQPDAARALGERVRGRAQKLALTVDADDTFLQSVVAALRPDMLQLHGLESTDRVEALRQTFGLRGHSSNDNADVPSSPGGTDEGSVSANDVG